MPLNERRALMSRQSLPAPEPLFSWANVRPIIFFDRHLHRKAWQLSGFGSQSKSSAYRYSPGALRFVYVTCIAISFWAGPGQGPTSNTSNTMYSTSYQVPHCLSGQGSWEPGSWDLWVSSCLQLHVDGIGGGLAPKDRKHRLLAGSFFPLLKHNCQNGPHRAHMCAPRQPASSGARRQTRASRAGFS